LSAVDIVVPCYNYGRFLGKCVESLLGQEGVDVRVLIIDDASSDDTPQVGQHFASHDPRVTFRRHAANRGHIATYNEGLLGWASAPYSLLISADDALAPGALARATKVMDRHGDIGMAYGMALTIGEDGPTTTTQPSITGYQVVPGSLFLQSCCKNLFNPVPTPTAVVRTETQHRLGGYKTEFPHTGDFEMWMRFAVHGPIAVLRDVQAYYRWHGRNMANRYYDQLIGDRRVMVQTYEHVLAPLGKRLPTSEQWLCDVFREMESQAFRNAANAFDRGETAEYLAWLEFANEISPGSRRPTVPFAETEAERQRTRDPRPSREMRYASRDAWATRLVDAVDRLVAERLLLAEDGDRLIAAARESWNVYQAL
jgi:glycosyltransferase involved in cell wall biosynthesis